MSRMGDLHIDITDALASGEHPRQIADKFKVPVQWVESVEDDMINWQAQEREYADRAADNDAIAYGSM